MTPDELALLRTIAAAPDDDTPRLVYADWLDEHGRPVRAEFIRLQCRIDQLEELDRHTDLLKRQQELIDNHFDELFGPLAGSGVLADVETRRGFVETVTLDVTPFLAHAADLAEALPSPRVEVEGVAARLADFLRCPHLGLVTGVAAYSPAAAENGIPPPGPDDLLAARGRLTRLETLDLEGCQIGDAGIRLLTTADLPALVELDLSGNQITDFGVAELINWPPVRRLKRLVLGGNPIGDQAAFELADRLGPNNRLENLNLRFTEIGHAGRAALLPRFGGRVELF